MTTKVNIKLTQKGSNFREVSFSTNHPINLVEMWMKQGFGMTKTMQEVGI